MKVQDNTDRYIMDIATRIENLIGFMRETQQEVANSEAAPLYSELLKALEPWHDRLRDLERGTNEAWSLDNSGDRHTP